MPTRPLRPCVVSGCSELVESGPCPAHAKERDASRRKSETWRKVRGARGGTIDIYQSARWKALRARVLREANYLCECDECKARPVGEPANTVDHRIPHRGDPALMWSRSNLMAMSHAHHSRKTAAETVNA